MKRSLRRFFLALCSFMPFAVMAQSKVDPPAPVYPLPSESQLMWHEMELNAFVHFTINTFTDKEWGFGDESPSLFNPSQFDPSQWMDVFRSTGVKGVILTTKHHDGFCLWPSAYTKHSVASSPFKGGRGDVVREVSEACRKANLKFGLYVSPWDRNHKDYGKAEYVQYYRNQLNELFSAYGPVFEMWFDGANGGDGYYGGANEKRRINGATYYEWPTTLEMVKKKEPEIIFFSDAGPGVRWCGNERGIAGETNWNTITPDTLYAGKAGIEKLLNTGSENGTHWIPSEVDVSIRPGWFYHEKEDSLVKSPEQLFEIYLSSVGRGSTLLLNIPPDKRGLIHERDVESMKGFRQLLDAEFKENLAQSGVTVVASSFRGNSSKFSVANLIDRNADTYWATDDKVKKGWVEVNFKEHKAVKYVLLQEYIKLGQRVKSFSVEAWDGKRWNTVSEGTTIGYKRIVKLNGVRASKIRIQITDAKACPVLSNIEVY